MLEEVTNQLKTWAVKSQLEHSHLDGLLSILRASFLPNLSKSSKTFLESDLKFNIKFMETSGENPAGEYYYFGIEEKLCSNVVKELHQSDLLELIVFVDGISPFKSGQKQCWPILCKVYHDKDIY